MSKDATAMHRPAVLWNSPCLSNRGLGFAYRSPGERAGGGNGRISRPAFATPAWSSVAKGGRSPILFLFLFLFHPTLVLAADAPLSATKILSGAAGFGEAVAYDHTTFVTKSGSGEISIYARNQGGADNFGLVKSITGAGARFGEAVALDGDRIAVGRPVVGGGDVTIYERNQGGADNWGSVKVIDMSETTDPSQVGFSIALEGDRLVIGAPTSGAADSGAASIRERNRGGADNWGEVAGMESIAGAEFGAAVAISEDTVFVAAPGRDSDTGAVHVFARNEGGADSWGEAVLLTASDAGTGDSFGVAVAAQADRLAVGATGTDQVYIFEMDDETIGWTEKKILAGDDTAPGDAFGAAVSLFDEFLAVGATGTGAGAVYLHESSQGGADSWGQVAKLTASGASPGVELGVSVALGRDGLAAGSTGAQAAYVYDWDCATWTEADRFVGSTVGNNDRFGGTVAADGRFAVFGASDGQAAYVFEREADGVGAWTETAELTSTQSEFATSLAIDGERIAVGSPNNGGRVQIFERHQGGADSWGEVIEIAAPNGGRFGEWVSLDGDRLAVGARSESGMGAAYVFERNHGGADRWGQVARVSDAVSAGARYGNVSLSGDRLAVAADSEDPDGAVFVYERNLGGADNWGLVATIASPFGADGAAFGRGLALDGTTLMVSIPFGDRVVVYERNQGGADDWGQVATLTGLTGQNIALSGDLAVAAADDSAIVYYRNQGGADAWGPVQTLTGSESDTNDLFASALAVAGDTLLVGDLLADVAGSQSGVGYAFLRNCCGDAVVRYDESEYCEDGALGDNSDCCDGCQVRSAGVDCSQGCDTASCDGLGVCVRSAILPSGTVCRPGSGDVCDVEEICNGVDPACPTDVMAGAGTVCRSGSGDDCDPDEVCSGVSGDPCPSDVVRSAGFVCRASADAECDPEEVCSGTVGETCPADSLTAAGTACGDSTDTDCNAADTCDGAGVCSSNFVASGTSCGDASHSECTDPDTCDGLGDCLRNDEALGTSCGDPTENECTSADICTGFGDCWTRDAAAGTGCGDQTDDACTDPDTCDGAGTCLTNHEASGTACGDQGNECAPADTCDGSGTCNDGGFVAAGTSCGDDTDDACTDPDTCDGAGTCEDNHANAGTLCGDVTDSECSDPDTCDGSGTCDTRDAAAGLPCGETAFTECSEPDTCDGAGNCKDNHLVGQPCTDDGDLCTADSCDESGVCAHRDNAVSCGDDLVCGPESCEDGNTDRGDGCSAGCEVEVELTKDEQKCIKAMYSGALKMALRQSKEVTGCVKLASKGKDSFPQTCAETDTRGKIAKEQAKLEKKQSKACEIVPPFGFAEAVDSGPAAVDVMMDLVAELMGDNLNRSVVEADIDKPAAKCQAAVLRGLVALFQTEAKLYLRCVQDGMRGKRLPQVVSATDMARCFDDVDADEKGKLARAVAKLDRTVTKKCTESGVELDWAFPGACAQETEFADCLRERVDCQTCRLSEAAGDFDADCDGYDDGSLNGSCGG